MTADKPVFPSRTTLDRGVTMVRRSVVPAIILAAFLLLAVPAFAATNNGARADYTTSDACATCHQVGQPLDAPKVYNDWAATAHGTDAEGKTVMTTSDGLPFSSVCAGCHTANYAPDKVVPVLVSGTYVPSVSNTTAPQAQGNAPFSELDIGCSSCHYGANVNGVLADTGNDVNDTAHTAPFAQLANADICGACHSRYSYTVNTITVSATPTPGTRLIQPQMAIGYPMLSSTSTPAPLASYLNIPFPGWTPLPNPSATTAAGLQSYWVYNGTTTVWPSKGHEGDAGQYPEWLSSSHANSLTDLKAAVGSNPPAACLQCHSADYQIAVAAGKTVPTGAQAMYGDTCVACHTPHNAGTARGVWDSSLDPQLVGNPSNPSDLCTTCHTAQLSGGVAAPGTTIYEDQAEVMAGTGAIGVPQGLPGVHEGKCVQCHMPPTTSGFGGVQLGGNHTMQIITPQVAAAATAGSTTGMPFSSCSTCHGRSTDPLATYLQDTIDQRQAAVHDVYNNVAAALHAAGLRMGYKQPAASVEASASASWTYSQNKLNVAKNSTAASDVSYVDWLNSTLNAKGSAKWRPAELLWQNGYTDWTYVGAEGSWGIHNYQYDSLVIEAALNYANQVNTTPQTVSFKVSKKGVKVGSKVKFSGTIRPISRGKITIQKKHGKNWLTWKTAKITASGKYSLTVKMTKKGTYYFRAFLPATPPNAGGVSARIKVVVRT